MSMAINNLFSFSGVCGQFFKNVIGEPSQFAFSGNCGMYRIPFNEKFRAGSPIFVSVYLVTEFTFNAAELCNSRLNGEEIVIESGGFVS